MGRGRPQERQRGARGSSPLTPASVPPGATVAAALAPRPCRSCSVWHPVPHRSGLLRALGRAQASQARRPPASGPTLGQSPCGSVPALGLLLPAFRLPQCSYSTPSFHSTCLLAPRERFPLLRPFGTRLGVPDDPCVLDCDLQSYFAINVP